MERVLVGSRRGNGHIRECLFSECGDGVEAAARASLLGGEGRVLHFAFEEARLFEAVEGAIKGAVAGEPLGRLEVANLTGNGIAVKLLLSAKSQIDAGEEDGYFNW